MNSPTPDRDAEMLAELAEMDLSAARHVHAQLIAATVPGEVADLSRAYQGASRSLRQTLAQKVKVTRDAADLTARTMRPISSDGATGRCVLVHDMDIGDRLSEIQGAVDRVVHAEHPDDEEEREALGEFLDLAFDDWMLEPDFTTADLDAQVLRACRAVGLSKDLATRWRNLPEPVPSWAADDDAQPTAAAKAAPAPPAADTG
jgi:hypothetical protein